MPQPVGERRPPAKRGRPQRKPVSRTPAWVPPAATVAFIALLVATFLVIRFIATPAPPPVIDPESAAAVVSSITGLEASELDQVGLGSATNLIKAVSGPALIGNGGRPVVFYMGAEYCPYCAAERWSMIIALSRFGAFTGLQATTSSSADIFPNTPTFTFRHATYTSQYVDFQPVETTDRDRNPLQSPTPEQAALVTRYDTSGHIPFVDFGNRYAFVGATYDPAVLGGMTWRQVADALLNPGSPQARAIIGSANLLTAAICKLTDQQPAAVCSSAAIQAIQTKLG